MGKFMQPFISALLLLTRKRFLTLKYSFYTQKQYALCRALALLYLINVFFKWNESCIRVRVRVTLQLTVSQSVSLGVEPKLGLLTRDFFFLKFLSCHLRAPSLTRGRVCHLLVYSQSTVVSQYLHKTFTYCVTHTWYLQYLCWTHLQ
jgi:hypothetical protein